jgi:tRNA nucleotidyltransferase/poly(A) polymerase
MTIQNAKQIMKALLDSGYQAYIVGGAVRDCVLGKSATDIDIATNALPENIREVASAYNWKIVEVGAVFGVMVIIIGQDSYEVTTYRSEIYGDDSHRPASVTYCTSLADDLSRRDFTMNALAMDIDGQIVDQFGGLCDIEKKFIRTVGDPRVRFAEDGLRMFRAARFAAQLGFAIEPETLSAISACLVRVSGLSVERVKSEIEKTLLSEHPDKGLTVMLRSGLLDCTCRSRENGQDVSTPILPELRHLDGLPQNLAYHYFDGWGHTLAVVCEAPRQLTLRWAALLHDVGKGWQGVRIINKKGNYSDPGHDAKGAELARDILERLKLPPNEVKRIAWLIRRHMQMPEPDYKAVLKWLRRLSQQFSRAEIMRQAINQLLQLHWADRVGGHVDPGVEDWREVNALTTKILGEVPFYPSQLAITGGDIAKTLGTGEQVRLFQIDLLTRVQSGQLVNNRENLIEALAARARRQEPR